MKATLLLTLLLIFLSCKKDEPIKSYLSEPPVLKGFNIRDGNGVLMQKIGVPNVKYSENPESGKQTFVLNSYLNSPTNFLSIFFGNKSSNKVKITVVRGVVDGSIGNISSLPNTIVPDQNLVVFEAELIPEFSDLPTNVGGVAAFNLPQNIDPGVFRVYIDYGDYILYDNIINE
ncbi:hypothetical protein CW751_00595 [Brumimicrobium salinarum]|uniref:Uncharacterized protein n=1 Tax=Brumimicrobium salinarum TaxID=2058658 RepID=A0A2I0R5N6_9FLAO|nr:hypothetical protein [Brumimicrobium salinarum]PKR81869.1 hypothetical protein CW751_00595 [Brumimicrobium salinarum]